MKIALQIIIAFVSGILGCWFFQVFLTDVTEKNTEIQAIHFSQDTMLQPSKRPIRSVQESNQTQTTELNKQFIQASATATPSVVFIKTTAGRVQVGLFDWFFGGGGSVQPSVSTGSGVIYSKDGYIITNNHVIEDAEIIEVIHEQKIYPAKLIGADPSSDIALLKIETNDLPAIKVGSSIKVQVGEWVLAVGNPFNLNSTVTAGIVSAKGRNLRLLKSDFPIESFIQTDAAINPGNSGGALVNLDGELVGINTAIYSRTGSYSGYGFAVPSDIVVRVVNDLIKYGEVQRVFTGAEVSSIDVNIAGKLGTNDLSGVVVTFVQPGSSAEKSGLQEGDIIFEINGESISGKGDFDEILSYNYPGEKIKLKYRRGDNLKETQLTLTNREGTTELLKREIYNSEKLGASLEMLSKVERQKFGISNGVRVVRLQNGLLRRMNIGKGFIFIQINRNTIRTPQDLENILTQLRGRVIIEGIDSSGSRVYYQFFLQ